MQGYSYSVFSLAAIAVHLIINFNLLLGRSITTARGKRYRGFLLGTLAYYVFDAAWGIFAGLRWIGLLYADTIFFFLSLAVFVFMWCRFVVDYLTFGKWTTRILTWFGYALLLFNLAGLAVNPFNGCFFRFDAQKNYLTGWIRDPAFYLLVAFNILIAVFALVKALRSRDSDRRRSMMTVMFCVTMAAAIFLQILWPLTPFTALGCLIGNCFLHVFVVSDEQTAKHLAKLEEALERARAAEKARSMFFSIVSHDIRTPLNAILGYSELLQSGITNEAERDEALRTIRSSGTTLLQLVTDVLDLAKMDSGKATFRSEPVQLSQLTDDVFATFRMTAKRKGIELVNRTTELPTIHLDEQRFRQILFNLVSNAVKFTERGSVTVSATYVDGDLEVAVSDTGCGIAPDMLSHIMEPFVQVQDPSHAADRTGGTGLGLSICKSLIEAMGGRFFVESELGAGSTFRFRIPWIDLHEEDEKETPAPEPEPPVKLKNLPKHVLIVDDSSVNRKVLAAFLKKAGIGSVDQAGDGAEALAVLDSAAKSGNPHDFVFSDLWMPNMNGLEFIEKLHADSRFGQLPVYALTADSECRQDSRIRLFNGVLLKPMTYEKLMDVFSPPDPEPAADDL